MSRVPNEPQADEYPGNPPTLEQLDPRTPIPQYQQNRVGQAVRQIVRYLQGTLNPKISALDAQITALENFAVASNTSVPWGRGPFNFPQAGTGTPDGPEPKVGLFVRDSVFNLYFYDNNLVLRAVRLTTSLRPKFRWFGNIDGTAQNEPLAEYIVPANGTKTVTRDVSLEAQDAPDYPKGFIISWTNAYAAPVYWPYFMGLYNTSIGADNYQCSMSNYLLPCRGASGGLSATFHAGSSQYSFATVGVFY